MGLFFRKTFSAADLLSVPFINLTHTIRYRAFFLCDTLYTVFSQYVK